MHRPSALRGHGTTLVATSMVATVLVLAGCSSSTTGASTGMGASRVELYESLPDLLEDTSLVVAGIAATRATDDGVTGPTGAMEVPASTTTTIDITEIVSQAGDDTTAFSSLSSNMTLAVRQFGTPDMFETPAPLMEPGQEYLLFLVPTGERNVKEPTYYVVGGSAGMYEKMSAAASRDSNVSLDSFMPMSTDGDTLPEHLSLDDTAIALTE